MPYIQVYAAPAKADRKDDFIAFNIATWPFFKGEGCLSAVECWGDDVPDGQMTSFVKAVALEEGEVVVLGWQVWPDQATAGAAFAKMEAGNVPVDFSNMPFDGARMIFGGFEPVMMEG